MYYHSYEKFPSDQRYLNYTGKVERDRIMA